MRFLPGLYSVSLHVFFPQSRRYYLSGKVSDTGALQALLCLPHGRIGTRKMGTPRKYPFHCAISE